MYSRQRNRLYDHEGFPAGSNCVQRASHYPKESANADIVIEGQKFLGFTYGKPNRYVP